ncbi:hypothetical protein [Phytoactinopolyspora mesophila]|uniref:Uncharacterized protein n=1 Tax=Phytoactinopolyspora mesophila TaxID=2650750 RepID=A0A7K3MCP5_9ACTN|nr:hypothetical protein [Phytoactinopolyspora mesophila]NDL60960.1 hypothetical protein [Phytoactinopolyspora mesophila]
MNDAEIRAAVDRLGEAITEVRNALGTLDREFIRLDVIMSDRTGGEQP